MHIKNQSWYQEKPMQKIRKKFVEFYNELKETKDANDTIYFMDGTQPQHNSVAV